MAFLYDRSFELKQVGTAGDFPEMCWPAAGTLSVTVTFVQQYGIGRSVVLPQDMQVALPNSKQHHNRTAAGDHEAYAAAILSCKVSMWP